MTTLTTLRTHASYLIGDPSKVIWDEITLDMWINFGIRDISTHFPRVLSADHSCTDDIRKYDLDDTYIQIKSVEYPKGEDPPKYLSRRNFTHPNFWQVDGHYDFIPTLTADSSQDPQLWISTKPATGETIAVMYGAEHSALSDPSDVCTLLERHEHLIALFVRWKAWQELATSEGYAPDPIKLLSATQEVNAYRAARAYRRAIRDAKEIESESAVQPWVMDKWGSIY